MPQLKPTPKPTLFKTGSFWLLMGAQISEQLGDSLNMLLLLALLTAGLGGDSRMASGFLFIPMFIPILLLGPIAGVFVDRWPRRNWLLTAASGRGLVILASALLAPWVIQGSRIAIALLVCLIVALSSLWQFYNPARSASIPEIVPDGSLDLANSLSVNVLLFMQILGFLAGGLLGDNLPLQKALLINAGLYAVCLTLVYFIRFRPAQAEEELKPLSAGQAASELVAAMKMLLSRTLRVRAAAAKAVLLVAGAGVGFTVLQEFTKGLAYPAFMQSLNDWLAASWNFRMGDLTRFTLLLLTAGVGAGVGAGLLALLNGRLSQLVLIQAGLFIAGASALTVSFAHTFAFAGAFMALMGMGAVWVLALTEARLQGKIPAQMRGKVLAAYFLARGGAAVGGAAIPGLLDKLGFKPEPSTVLSLMGATVVAFWLLTSIYEYHAHKGEAEQ